ncbi:hypothetical protein FB446DRAFT_742098 [Lentinula raphanica]|nr:hypothetical protein FB446DRAFT_742098 [Lentinula raphanica]
MRFLFTTNIWLVVLVILPLLRALPMDPMDSITASFQTLQLVEPNPAPNSDPNSATGRVLWFFRFQHEDFENAPAIDAIRQYLESNKPTNTIILIQVDKDPKIVLPNAPAGAGAMWFREEQKTLNKIGGQKEVKHRLGWFEMALLSNGEHKVRDAKVTKFF